MLPVVRMFAPVVARLQPPPTVKFTKDEYTGPLQVLLPCA